MKKLITTLFLALFILSQGMAYAVPCFVSASHEAETQSSKHDCCPDMQIEPVCESMLISDCFDVSTDAVTTQSVIEKHLKKIEISYIDVNLYENNPFSQHSYYSQAPPDIIDSQNIIFTKSLRLRI